jgi:probable DNA metabolism protein
MFYYTYDGTFNGLLTIIYEIYYRRQIPEQIVPAQNTDFQLFVRQEHFSTDDDKAAKVYQAIENKISIRAIKNAYYAYLSEHPQAGIWIYEYLNLGWKLGSKLDLHLTNDKVHRVHRLGQKVRTEKHRLLGLLRFQLLKGNIYYAAVEPDHNVIELIAPHFARRMASQNWIIHDLKRDLAAVYNQQEWVSTSLTLKQRMEMEREEEYYQMLWKQYYESIAIPSRINPKLQKRCMPQRYWKHLVENN